MLSQFTDVSSDPLDMVLFGVGLRLLQLSKFGDPQFTQLLDNRNFTIQLGSETENIARHYVIDNGSFTQHAGKATEPTLTITFKDSMTGVKLLTKGDATAFMVGIQNGDVKMAGDYSLLMWFNQVAKFIVPEIPEKFQPIVEQAKPLLVKATPIAKELFSKASNLFTNLTDNLQEKNNKSKYFHEANTQSLKDVTKVDDNQQPLAQQVVEKTDKDTLSVDTINPTDDLSPTNTSQSLKAKHADDEIIAENVETDAVNNEKSPITNITVTRHAN